MSRPTSARCWWHVMIGTYASWLPGDKRGFRNRGHRIHSSGDYKNPPPADEHDGLHHYNLGRAGERWRSHRSSVSASRGQSRAF